MMKIIGMVLTLTLVPIVASAQTVRADRFVLTNGTCILRSGSGTPEGVILGKVCDTYWRVDTGAIYIKSSGFNTITGWVSASVSGSGTIGTLPKWTGPTQLGDSMISEVGGDIVVAPTGKDILPALSYDTNLGALDKKFLTLHAAELWVETLVAQNTMATIGGRVLVAPTNILVGDLTPGAIAMTVKYNNFTTGDRVYMEANGKVEFFAVTSNATGSAGAYFYTVTRNLDGSGADFWYGGDAILNTGQTGNGFMDLYSVRGVRSGTEIGPTIVGNVRNSSAYNDWTPRWAIGNLNGLYGYSSSIYGAAFGVPSAAWIKIDPTNGIRIGHNTTTKISLDAATGNASFSGDITSNSGTIGGWTILTNYLYSGSTSATRVTISSDGTDAFWAGNFNSVSAPFRVTTAGALTATNATITGAITATSGSFTGTGSGITAINGANITTGTVTATQIAASTITATQIAANTITAAKMNVTSLSSITANIGAITAGSITGVTITAGGSGGDVTLDSSGVTITAGTSDSQAVKWGTSGKIFSNSGGIMLYGTSTVYLEAGSNIAVMSSVGFWPDTNNAFSLGTSTQEWTDLFLTGTVYTGLSGGGNRVVCVDNNGKMFQGASNTAC